MGDNSPQKKRRAGLGRNPTAAYRGGSAAWWGYGSAALDNSPIFTYLDVPRMLRDPQVRFLERMWRAPFQKVKWAVKSDNPAVAKFVGTTLRRFWRRSLPKILSRYWRFGYGPGGAEYCFQRSHWRLDRVRAIEPQDASPRVWSRGPHAGRPAGFTMSQGAGFMPGSGTGSTWVSPSHAFWFAGFADLTPWHDVPPISGLFEPWLEKRGRNGAVHSRRLFFRKAAWRGAILYHPPGERNVGTDEHPQMRDCQDIAREALDYHEAGSTLTLENELLNDNNKAWEYQEAEAVSDVSGIRDYPKDLDKEMATGAGIPPEVLEASEVGSGWSGRLIPLLGYLGTVDELAGLAIDSADQWMRPLVRVNFGPKSWYEIEPQSLADEVQQQQGKGGPAPQNPAQLFDNKPPQEQPGQPEQKALSLSATLPPERPHRYACVFAPLRADAVRNYVADLQRQIKPEDLADRGLEADPHVTVRCGLHGDDSELPAALETLAARRPFEVRFEGPSHFAGPDADVVILPVMAGFGKELREMHGALGDLNHTDTHPTYRPHLTVAYVRPGTGAAYAARLHYPRTTLAATVSDLVYSDRDGQKTPLTLRPAADPAPAPLELSWTAYEGPKGGKGWVSDTGEVRYQSEKPADAEGGEQGPESVFAHPEYAHIPEHTSDAEPRDFGKIRSDAHAAAEAEGLDPAELHRRAARGVHQALDWSAGDPTTWTPARHLQNHEVQEASLRRGAEASDSRAAAARAEEALHRQREAGHRERGQVAAAERERGLANDKYVEAAQQQKAAADARAKADEHKRAADRVRAGEAPKIRSWNKRNVVAGAYKDAHKQLAEEKAKRDTAARFADTYFEEEAPRKRAAAYLSGIEDGTVDADLLPEDTRSAVAEDLTHLPPPQLAGHVASAVNDFGPDSTEGRIALAAAATAAGELRPKPVPFDGKPERHFLVTPDDVGEDAFRGLQAAATLLPGVKAPLDGTRALLAKHDTPLGKILEGPGSWRSLEDDEGLRSLFTALKSDYQLPLENVPASARDYGGTSGSKGSGEYQPEDAWDVNAVPVYKRLNENYYVKLRSGADEDGPGYAIVHRADVPPLARLPEVYWAGFDPENDGTSDDAVERKQRREAKSSEEGAVQKRDIGDHRQAIKKSLAEVGKLKTAWNQALKGVPEDERPEEPDWGEVDGTGLGDSYDERGEHAAALDQLRADLHNHVESLKEHIGAAKEHAGNHRANAAASEQAQSEWEQILEDVPEEDRPEEPDWRDDLGGDRETHAKYLSGHLRLAREAAQEHAGAHHEAAERHRAEWRKHDARIKEKLAESAYAKKIADADDDTSEAINDRLYGKGADNFQKKFDLDRDSYPDGDAGDAAHAAVEEVQSALDDFTDGSTPDHDYGPDHDDYALDEEAELPDRDQFDSPEERAIHFEQSADEHKARADELAEEVPKHYAQTLSRSDEWRKEMREHLERVQNAAQAAIKALPEGDYPGAAHRADLKELAKRAGKLLTKVQPHKEAPTELSATPADDADSPDPLTGRLGRMRAAKLSRLIALAMVKLQAQAREKGDPRAAARALAQLAELAHDPERAAAVVGLAPLELSWQPYIGKRGERAGQQVGWFDPESKEVRYQTSKPGEGAAKARGRTASGTAGLAIAHKIHAGTATAEDLGELVDHLRVMTVPRLRNVAAMLDKSLSGLKNRDKMVTALLGHVGGLTAADGAKSDGGKAEPAPTGPKAEPAPQPGEVRTVPTGDLKVDPQRFQFKLNTSNPAGVTKELQEVKAFNPEFAGVVSVWRDPADGQDYVVNGHHRHELAARTGHPNLAVRYLQAKDAREARAKGALINIAEGRGTAVDAAKFMRDMGVSPQDLEKHGVSLKGKLAADAAALTRLNDKAFDRVARGTLDPEKALAVARHLDNPDRQEKLFKLLDKREETGKDLSGRTIEELARQMAAAPAVTTKEESLFGDDENEDDAFVERADLAGYVRAALAQEHNDFGAVASDRRAGNSLNVEENKKRAAEADALKNVYDLSAHRKGAVAGALDAGAVKLKQAKSKKERDRARTDTLDAVRTALRGRLADPTGTGRPGNGGGKGGVDPGRAQGSGAEPAAVAAGPAANTGRSREQPTGVAPAPTSSAATPASAPKAADRGSLDSIKEVTDRALGVKHERPPEAPAKGQYGALLRAAASDPEKFAELEKLAPLPTLDRNDLLAAVAEVYGPAVHAEAKKKSKQGIVALLKAARPV